MIKNVEKLKYRSKLKLYSLDIFQFLSGTLFALTVLEVISLEIDSS